MDPRKKQRSCKEGGSFSGSPECNPLRMVLADGRAVDLARLDISGAVMSEDGKDKGTRDS